MNSVCEDIKDILVSAGEGIFNSKASGLWGIFCFVEPKNSKQTITIVDTGGFDKLRSVNRQQPIENPTFQIRVIDTDYRRAFAKCQAIDEILDDKHLFSLNGSQYMDMKKQGDTLPLGKDENNNFQLTINYYTFRKAIV